MLKLDDNPPVLVPWAASLRDLRGPWWVAHTKARFEKAFAWDLLRRRIGYFLPMVERVRVSGGRKRRVPTPLFGGYVFFCGDDQARFAAMTTNRLCQTIPVADQAQLIDELAALEQALAGQAPLDPYPFAAVGRRCRVRGGPMLGIEGVVVERAKLARVVLQVSILGQGASMEVDADLLESLD